MKKLLSFLLCFVMILGLAACASKEAAPAPAEAEKPTEAAAETSTETTDAQATAADDITLTKDYVLSIGGGSSGGGSYTIAAAYCDILSKLDHVSLSVEETSGGIESIQLIADGALDFGTSGTSSGYLAYNGLGTAFNGEVITNICSWWPLYNYPFQIVVMADSDINCVSDLIGKRVSVNVKGNSAENTAREIFTALDMMTADGDYNFDAYYLSYSDALDYIKTGKLDVILISTGAPTPTVQELEASNEIKFIPFTEEEMEKVTAMYPYYSAGTMPAGTYSSQTEDIRTIHANTIAFCSADLDEDLVYLLTKTLWESRDKLTAAHATQANLNEELIESSMSNLIPVHPGALRFYQEELGILMNEK